MKNFILSSPILPHFSGCSTIKKNERKLKKILIPGLICLSILFVVPASAQTYLKDIHSKKAHTFDLQGNLHLLNLCEEKPEHINNIYTEAFKKFDANSNFTFADLSEEEDFTRLCERNSIILTGGPMLGNVSSTGVNVWVRTLFPAKVEINVEGENKTYGPVKSTSETDLTAVVKVTGLKPGTKYNYNVLVNGEQINLQAETFFVTPPDNPAKTSIVFGSCFHRWGLCNQRLINEIKNHKPLAMLANGDIAAQDRLNNIAMHRADYLLRDFQTAWKNLVANIPFYATWDDHDYFNNDLWGTPKGFTTKDKKAVSDVFRNSWNNPPYGSDEDGAGVYFRSRIGPADVIMLDNRYFREKGNFLGDEQMQWLEEQLLDCKGPFIILSNGTMFSDYVSDGKDSWGKFDPESREKIFNLIEKNKIGGVLLISGDRHGARAFRIPRPSGFNFYEFGMGSLGGRVGPPPISAQWNTQLFGISGEFAFGEFLFDTTLPDPEVTFRAIHESGTIFYEITLSKSQLTPMH